MQEIKPSRWAMFTVTDLVDGNSELYMLECDMDNRDDVKLIVGNEYFINHEDKTVKLILKNIEINDGTHLYFISSIQGAEK